VNPAIFAIQRLILKQSDQSNGQQSSQ